jgi:acyl-CoA synthetase (AMP-forming)/AMP-acid ligase II
MISVDETVLGADHGCATLVQVLRWRATHQPERLGYRFLVDGEAREDCLTYGDLDRRARAIAALLQGLGAMGERVLLVYPPGLEFICAWFGCAYAGAVPVVAYPPHPARMQLFLSRTSALVGDARPATALTTTAILEELPAPAMRPAGLRALRWSATDPELEPPPELSDLATDGHELAFLQYTSGSTTVPRGVMITHDNLMHNLGAIRDSFWQTSDVGSVSWLPPYHDMGLIGGILGPLYVGSPVTLLPPLAFVQRPRRWLQAITRFHAAVSGGPNFAYDLCLRRLTPEQCAGLNLSSWRVAFNGAEPVNAATLREFAARFAPYGFRPDAFKPCYGLAESTLLVSSGPSAIPPRLQSVRQSDLERHRVVPCAGDTGDARTLVSCGRPVATTIIVDPESLRICAMGQVGEIWVSGRSVAPGYWNQPDETMRTFHAHPAGAVEGEAPFLRTGDLGFLLDGELFVTGRLKDLIIIDGANHYPQDIERTVGTCQPALDATDCAVFSLDGAGGERVIVVAGVPGASRLAVAELRRAIRTAVAEQHDLRVHDVVCVRRGGIPKTSSGKVRRHACRAAYLAGTLDVWGTS